MRINRISALVVTFMLLFGACSEPDYVRDYPQIVSTVITSITSKEIDVKATIGTSLREKITDHGFIWSDDPRLSIANASVVSLGKPTSENFFAEIRSTFVPKKMYYLMSFLKTEKKIVYGVQLEFTIP